MLIAGPKYAQSVTQLASGSPAWDSVEAVSADDGSEAVVVLPNNNISQFIVGTGLAFDEDIPERSPILGVQLHVKIRDVDNGSTWPSLHAALTKNGAQFGSTKIGGFLEPLTSTPVIISFGAANDLWGLGAGLKAEDIRDSTFGYRVRAAASGGAITAAIDFIRMTVYFDEPPPLPVGPPAGKQARLLYPVRS